VFRKRAHIAPEAVDLVISVVRTALITLGVVEALAGIGLNLGGVIAGLGIVGLAFGFAAQDSLANLIAGFTILWDRPLRVGEWVRVGDGPVAGRVTHLTLRTTRIETVQDGLLVIPNKDVTGSRLYNLSRHPGAVIRIAVTVAADADLERVRATLRKAASNVQIDVVLSSMGDSATTLEIVVPVADYGTFRAVRSTLLDSVASGLRGAGVKFTDIKVAT
jgi:small conductance mechanosensitive channel